MIASAYASLAEFTDRLYAPRRLIGSPPITVKKYHITIRHFGRHLGRVPTLTDLDEDRIADFLVAFGSNHAPYTVKGARSCLMALAVYAHRRGLIAEVPDVARIPVWQTTPDSYTIEDIAKLLAGGREERGEICGIPASRFFPAVFLVVYDTGSRISPVWRLTWRDWDAPQSGLWFRPYSRKERRERLVRVSRQTAEAIEDIREPKRELIFPWPINPRTQYKRIKRIFWRAGLPWGRKDLFHRIRRTTATLAKRYGADPTLQLGHSSDAVTRAHYLDPTGELQAADVLPRIPILRDDPQRRLF